MNENDLQYCSKQLELLKHFDAVLSGIRENILLTVASQKSNHSSGFQSHLELSSDEAEAFRKVFMRRRQQCIDNLARHSISLNCHAV